MAFPTSPSDGQEYTTSLGTVYEYVEADDKWILLSTTLTGATGVQGETGVSGDQGETGVAGAAGDQGETGVQGDTGLQGTQGVTGIDFGLDTSTFDATDVVDLSDGLKEKITTASGAESGILGIKGMPTGANALIYIVPGITAPIAGTTGIKWPDGVEPTFSSETGVVDLLSISFDGGAYYGNLGQGYQY